MLSNFHTHTKYCDGKNTPEEMILQAMDLGFSALGFSGHAYTYFDTSYCTKDEVAYISEINALKEKYKDKIEIYLGAEEDMYSQVDRTKFEYIIGSCHYVKIKEKYYPLDSKHSVTKEAIDLLDGNPITLAEQYYSTFTDYIFTRKPDIIGHFDLITKYDECEPPLFLTNPEYEKIAEKYIRIAAKANCIFEVNTGAISRGYRKTPYPSGNLLNVLKQEGARIILSSDCHNKDHLAENFVESTKLIKDAGFNEIHTIKNGSFTAVKL